MLAGESNPAPKSSTAAPRRSVSPAPAWPAASMLWVPRLAAIAASLLTSSSAAWPAIRCCPAEANCSKTGPT
jgi:hypothetical protein